MSDENEPETERIVMFDDGEMRITQYEPQPVFAWAIVGAVLIFLTFFSFRGEVGKACLSLLSFPVAIFAMNYFQELRLSANRIQTKRKIFRWEFDKTYEPGAYAKVAFARFKQGENSYVHKVVLRSADDKSELSVLTGKDLEEVRRYSERIAKHVQLPVCDLMADGRLRSPEELDMTVAQKTEVSDLPETPQNLVSQIRRDNDGNLLISVPSPEKWDDIAKGYRRLGLLVFFAPMAVVLVVSLGVVAKSMVELAVVLVAFGALYAGTEFFISTMLGFRAQQKADIKVGGGQFEVTMTDHNNQTSTTRIPLNELEELFHQISPEARKSKDSWLNMEWPSAIVAKSDTDSLSFANWLSVEEKDYLTSLLSQLVARVGHDESSSDPMTRDYVAEPEAALA